MKKITLTKKDTHDLALVLATIIKDDSDKLSFKDILNMQKAINYFMDSIKDFNDAWAKLNGERDVFVKNAQNKIQAFKQKLQEDTQKEGKVKDDYQAKVDSFTQEVVESVQKELDKDLSPRYTKLYDKVGKENVDLDLEEEWHTAIVTNFELFAKDKYIDKNKMVEVYDILKA